MHEIAQLTHDMFAPNDSASEWLEQIPASLSAPVPMMTMRVLFGRDRYLDARAEAAPVRSLVTVVPSTIASGVPFAEKRKNGH